MPEADPMVGVLTTDRALVVRSWDAWLEAATGLSAQDACGRPLAELFPDIDERGLLARLRRVVETGAVEVLAPAFHRYLIPCPPRRPSEHFDRMQQHVTISPLRGASGVAGTIVAIEDVTTRLERERALAAELRSPDEAVRLRAVAAVTEEGGRPAVLADALGDESWRVRRAVAGGLAALDDASAVDVLVAAIRERHRDPAVLNAAVTALAQSAAAVLAPVLELLRSPDAEVRTYAALALGQLGDARAVPWLLQALQDPDTNVRYHTIEALARLGAREAAPALCQVAEGGDEFLAFAALDALAELREPAVVPRLLPLLDRDGLRAAAARAIGQLADEDAAPVLAQRVNRPGVDVLPLAGALAAMHERLERTSGAGELVADAIRGAVSAEGVRALAAALPYARDEELDALVRVLGWLDFEEIPAILAPLLEQAHVRRSAAAALTRRGAAAVPVLLQALGSDELQTRKAAAQALGEIGSPLAVTALAELLEEEPELAVVAAGALGAIGDRRAFEPLLARLEDPDAAVRQAAIAALHSIGHPAMRRRVGPLLSDASPRMRESAVRIAGYFGYPEWLPVLLDRCGDPHENVRRAAVEHIPFYDDPRVAPALAQALADAPGVRAAAARSLAHVERATALPLLERALADADPWVRYHAARSAAARDAAPLLARLSELALTDPAPPVRIAAADALGGTRQPGAATALAALAATSAPDVAQAAVRALGRIPGGEALGALLGALDAPEAGVRRAALAALGERRDAGAVPRLRALALEPGDETVRRAAVAALGAIGGGGAVPALLAACADARLEDAAVAALAGVPAEGVPALGEGLAHADARVRRSVVDALARRRDGHSAPLLARALEDPSRTVRLAAAHALRRLDLHAARGKLERVARFDDDAAVREAAQSALLG